jgi:hypothetical protein
LGIESAAGWLAEDRDLYTQRQFVSGLTRSGRFAVPSSLGAS